MKTQEIGQSGMIASRVALGVMRMDALDAADAARTVAVLKHMTIQAWCPFQSGTEYGPFVGNEHFPELNAELTRLAGNPLV